MAWVTVTGSGGLWEYDNAPSLGTLANNAIAHPDDEYYRDAAGTVTAGIRTYVSPAGNTQETYVKCRKVGSNNAYFSELSKTYYDNQ